MPDFTEIEWEGYRIKLRAADSIRRFIAGIGLFDIMPYFESSDINLDIRISVPKLKNVKAMKDIIKYKWWLYLRSGKCIPPLEEDSFRFFNVSGEGEADLSKANKFKDFERLQPKELFWTNAHGMTFFRQNSAINIGHISEFDHYGIAMQFRKNNGSPSEPQYMGGFTVFDKNTLRHTLFISVVGIITIAIAAVVLRTCG